jgi:hypothetical protein
VVVQDGDKRYELGPAMFYLGSAYARATPLYRSARAELVAAANEFGVTAAIAVPWENHHLVLNAHRGGDSDVAVRRRDQRDRVRGPGLLPRAAAQGRAGLLRGLGPPDRHARRASRALGDPAQMRFFRSD